MCHTYKWRTRFHFPPNHHPKSKITHVNIETQVLRLSIISTKFYPPKTQASRKHQAVIEHQLRHVIKYLINREKLSMNLPCPYFHLFCFRYHIFLVWCKISRQPERHALYQNLTIITNEGNQNYSDITKGKEGLKMSN